MNAAATVLITAAVVIWTAPFVALVAVYLRERRPGGAPMVRAESLSERHDRLDAEALAANIAAFERLGKEANR